MAGVPAFVAASRRAPFSTLLHFNHDRKPEAVLDWKLLALNLETAESPLMKGNEDHGLLGFTRIQEVTQNSGDRPPSPRRCA
jgi:hypothetical protein